MTQRIKSTTKAIKQISERVWYLPAHPDPQKIQPLVGIVVCKDETILIDAGNTPLIAKLVLSELHRIKAPPVRKIIYTHHHWDHVFGASAYGAQAVAHTLCATKLEREAKKPWSWDFLASEVARDSSLQKIADILKFGIEDWEKFKVVIFHTTFDDTLTLEGDGYKLELEHVGGNHASDSIVVKVVNDRVMFLGDSFYPPPARLNPTDTGSDAVVLQTFLEAGYYVYLDGHSEPFSTAELAKGLLDSQF